VILSILILIAAVLSKVLGCGLGAAGFGFGVAKRVGLGMIPRGEFCIVAGQIGLAQGVLAADTYAMVIFVAVATTVMAPPLVQYAFRNDTEPELATIES